MWWVCFVPNERWSSEQACFISHMQLCSSLKHTYSHIGEAVASQQESWQFHWLMISLSLLSQPGVAYTSGDRQSKSAVCHSQGKAYSVKRFTYTFKTWRLSISEITPANACALILTHQNTQWSTGLKENLLN